MYGELWRKDAPPFGLKALCLSEYQIPPIQTMRSAIIKSLSVEHNYIKSYKF